MKQMFEEFFFFNFLIAILELILCKIKRFSGLYVAGFVSDFYAVGE